MSTTLLPFLYQTRTLQRLAQSGHSTPAFRALLHSTARSNRRRDRPRPHPPRHDDIPFELPEGYDYPGKDQQPEEEVEPGGVRSTITPQERDVFSRIFEEIASRNQTCPPPAASSAPPPSDNAVTPASTSEEAATVSQPSNLGFTDSDDFNVRTNEPNPETIRSTINIIVQDAAEVQTNSRRNIKKPFGPLHPLDQTSAASEWEKALLRFPPSLRRAARMALGTMEEDQAVRKFGSPAASAEASMGEENRAGAQIDLALDPLSKSVRNEALRREERVRVETKMREAKTDFELWDVLEEEVFPMVQKLGIDEASSKANTRSRKTDKSKLPLNIYGPLYPAYLLNALRLFDTQFSRSSPLALHILPRVKALGPASYVLGVSTPFYNELARILWNRYGDPTAVLNLFEEMRVAGLYLDEGTRGVVRSIDHFMGSVQQGKWGPFLREVVSLPEYQFAVSPRIRHWLKTINSHITERRNELVE
ncbi:hypothetical protein C8A03DRAFT_45507 [Achaetomium macrosporum]|uniref:Mtf2-like C-terminal domain-containing protein n=1 Tax=Achaetomium macrosporum TaxID=79813 RepID=A0AAN7C8V8_9PEZI|nr:hypothetical protein C8A03DRAFT_45507 [Achaetomium macrosporum]